MNSVVFDYNTARPRLIIPEYGRHVQRMVEDCMLVEDRTARTRTAHGIIQVIGRLNPMLRNSENGDRTLWDHLYIMSEFKLDVDGPFPKPAPEDLQSKPERVPYPKQEIRFGHYSKLVERMIQRMHHQGGRAGEGGFTMLIANLMKKQFLQWNRDSVGDGVIIKDLDELSKGKLRLASGAAAYQLPIRCCRRSATAPATRWTLRKQRYGGGGGGSSGGGGNNKKRHRNRKKNRY